MAHNTIRTIPASPIAVEAATSAVAHDTSIRGLR